MKRLSTLLAVGLCAAALAGCETSGGGYGAPGIYEGPVRSRSTVVVVDSDPRRDGIDRRYREGRYERIRETRRERRIERRGERYDDDGFDDDRRYGDRRDPCLGLPGYDPRYDRCSR